LVNTAAGGAPLQERDLIPQLSDLRPLLILLAVDILKGRRVLGVSAVDAVNNGIHG